MAEKEINITYETLFDLLRREKNRAELQKLSDTFFEDVDIYIKEKHAILKDQQMKIGMSAIAEKEKTSKQIENINNMLKGLLERRQQKIIDMAIVKSRTLSDTTDYSALLKEEQEMFNELVELLNRSKKKLLLHLITKPEFIEPKYEENESKELETTEEAGSISKTEETKPKIKEAEETEKTRLIRFIYSVPKFLGHHLDVYGPFEEDDTANLPEEIADILIKKGRAEEIKK
ncbi:MAG: hypothetical protein KKF74_04895 [Nanoarchaeota archaeon]|nr:hypothetical protein [Nanoarchaeota archaeon]